jgi:hypothetical protein
MFTKSATMNFGKPSCPAASSTAVTSDTLAVAISS